MSLFPAAGYKNPFRSVSNLTPERVDQGVDYTGSGPVHALGKGVITQTTGNWPGGGFIDEHLTGGIYKGRDVYVAEYIQPTVKVGQHVTSHDVIGIMSPGPKGTGIETGWAGTGKDQGNTLAWQQGQANYNTNPAQGSTDPGAWPTTDGTSYNSVLTGLGAPSGIINYPVHGSHGRLFNKGHIPTAPPTTSTKNKTTTDSISLGGITSSAIFGVPLNKDVFERVGLVIFGALLIIVGLVILVKEPATNAVSEATGLKRGFTSLTGSSGSGNYTRPGPTPEQQADRAARLQLAQRNTAVGEAKAANKAQTDQRRLDIAARNSETNKQKAENVAARERRLALAKPKSQRHSGSGVREPNPAPRHG